MTIELGSKVRDQITGFTGIAVSRHSYLTGCDRISVQPPVGKDGKVPDSQAFDEPMLELIEKPSRPRTKPGPGMAG